MIDVTDPEVMKKLKKALRPYANDGIKQRTMMLYLTMAGRELDDVDQVVLMAQEAMEVNERGDTPQTTEDQTAPSDQA